MGTTKREQDESIDESERKAKRFRDCDYNNTVTVLVGPEKQPFSVYKDIICASSKFFKAACSERWAEGKEKKVSLPEVEPKIFQSYVAWLYSGTYRLQASKNDQSSVMDSALDAAVELYLLADVLDDICFRNKMMEIQICHDLGRVPSTGTLRKLWNRTPSSSRLRKMYVERFVLRLCRETFAKFLSKYPVGLVQEVALSSLQRLGTQQIKVFATELESFLEPVPEDT